MGTRKREAIIPEEIVERLLRAAGTELILVGGQALKVWMDRYRVSLPAPLSYVSRDVDLLAESAAAAEAVQRLARALGGHAVFPKRRAALTALVGQAVRDVSEDEVFNVDVVHRVFGADDDSVRVRAVELRLPTLAFRVMHPLDVLKSRVDNLAGLPEKQNELGEAQLRASIEVAKEFQKDAAKTEKAPSATRPAGLRYVSFIERLARSAAGKKVAQRYGLYVADAIVPDVIHLRAFREEQLPRIVRLMSPERRAALRPTT